MKGLEGPDLHQFNAASGWLGLGNCREARAELQQLSPAALEHPAVLDLRWTICAAEQQWDEAYELGQQLLATVPEEPNGWLHCAYALRRRPGGSVQQARDFLLPAAEKFTEEPVIPFNLACYECQLQQLDEARRWFQRACRIGGEKRMRTMALADEDLKLLWPELRRGTGAAC